jgi:hypothetical protein
MSSFVIKENRLTEVLMSPVLLEIAHRYFNDGDFRTKLHTNPADALAYAEYVLSADEFKIVVGCLSAIKDPENFVVHNWLWLLGHDD